MENEIDKKRIVYTLFLLISVSMGLAFSSTQGLVASGEGDELTFVTDYLSSGSDDNVVIEISWLLFLVPLLIGVFRIRKRVVVWEYAIAMGAFAL
ncbi:MAG TPA: hypothetical protein VLZ44_09490 [Treponemataceae bacterium]|nr:hypothetical protein [Treponemataceae bacterium]